MHTGIFALKGEELVSYEENPQYNPLYVNADLRRRLEEVAGLQREPVLFRDIHQIYFACIRGEEGDSYFIGPMATGEMNRVQRHRFYHFYGVDEKWEKALHFRPVTEIFKLTAMLAETLAGLEFTEREIVEANQLFHLSREEELMEQTRFDIKEDEADIYRHSYQEERRLLDMVREGNVEEAVRIARQIDPEIGNLGSSELEHWRNVLVISATLCARAAIEGGVMPYIAYRMSGFYINKGSGCRDIPQILQYRNHAVEELARRVQEVKAKRHTSSYTEQCKDYVRKHFKEKIYLDEIADKLGISSSYLSRLFRKETGVCFQDYVTQVRVELAANLLTYSEEPLPKIAEYVNFPSQSYFGKKFKELKHMTPRQYRERYKPLEFYEEK